MIAGNYVDVNGKVVNGTNPLITHQQDTCCCAKWIGEKAEIAFSRNLLLPSKLLMVMACTL